MAAHPLVLKCAKGIAILAMVGGLGWCAREAWRALDLVPIPDPALEAAIRLDAPHSHRPLTRATLASLTEIHCADPADLDGLQYCTNLERLSVGVPSNRMEEEARLSDHLQRWQPLSPTPRPALTTDLSRLTILPRLMRLSLWGYDLHDLSPVCQSPNLTFLSVTVQSLESFTPLLNLPQLQGVYVQTTHVPDVLPLTRMPNLREIGIASLDGSGSIPYATEVWLIHTPDLRRLELVRLGMNECKAIATLPQLQVLNLRGNAISDVGPIAELRALRLIDLRENQISDVRPLAAMVQRNRLRAKEITIDLRGNPLKMSAVPHLNNMRALGAIVMTGKDEAYRPGEEVRLDPKWAEDYFNSAGTLMSW